MSFRWNCKFSKLKNFWDASTDKITVSANELSNLDVIKSPHLVEPYEFNYAIRQIVLELVELEEKRAKKL